MKINGISIILVFLTIVGVTGADSQVIFSENLGSTVGLVPTGWTSTQIKAPGTNDWLTTTTTVSSTTMYTGASASGNISADNDGLGNPGDKALTSVAISTVGKYNLILSWSERTTSTFTAAVKLEYSTDNGSSWTTLAYEDHYEPIRATLGSITFYQLNHVKLPAAAENISQLVLRWSFTPQGNSGTIRYDDFCVCSYNKLWDGGAGDGLWSSATNWGDDVVPISTDYVLLDNTLASSSYAITYSAAASAIAALAINSPANTITLEIASGSAGNLTVNNNTLADVCLMKGAYLKLSKGVAGVTFAASAGEDGQRGSTVEYALNGTETITDCGYGALKISGTGTKTWSAGNNRRVYGNLDITVASGFLSFGNGVNLVLDGNLTVPASATFANGSSANRVIAYGGGRIFTLNGTARVTANETQTAAATSPFAYQYNNFATYTFGSSSWIAWRSPTTTAVTQGVDGITGSPFANVELAAISNLTAAGTNTFTFKTDVNITGTLAVPRIVVNTSLLFNFGSKTVSVGGPIQVDGLNTNTQSGGRTYTMGTSTIVLNGTSSQNTLGGTNLPTSFYNLTLNNSSGVTVANAVTVTNTLTLGGNNTYTNLSNISGYSGIVYAATSPQTTGSELGGSITNLTINNSNGVTLGNPTTVTGALTLSNGSLNTGANVISLGSSATISGEQSARCVVGNLAVAKTIGPTVGSDQTFGGIGVTLQDGSDDLGTVSITRVTGTAISANSNTGIKRSWTISSTLSPSQTRNLTLSWVSDDDNSKNLANSQAYQSTDAGSTWSPVGVSQDASTTRSVIVATTSLGVWTVSDAGSPLPVELVSFTATASGANAQLSWITASESNNYGFDVERRTVNSEQLSVNNWTKVAFIEGHGTTSTPQNYSFADNTVISGKYSYRLKQVDRNGKFTYSKEVEAVIGLTPDDYKLSQNYPNPFNPSTTIRFAVRTAGQVSLKVYNTAGQEVRTLFNEAAEPDKAYSVLFDGTGMASGTYFYVLQTPAGREVKKMLMVK